MGQTITPEEFMVLRHAGKSYPLRIVIPNDDNPLLRRHHRRLVGGYNGVPYGGRRLPIALRLVERELLRLVELRKVEREGYWREGMKRVIDRGVLYVFEITELGEQEMKKFVPPSSRYVVLADQSWE